MTSGAKLNTCMPMFKQSDGTVSIMLQCVDGEVSYYEYDDSECAGDVIDSKTIIETGCNTWSSTDNRYL